MKTQFDHWNKHSKLPTVEDFGELGVIQVYDTQYKFTWIMHMAGNVGLAMRPEWVWRRVTPPE